MLQLRTHLKTCINRSNNTASHVTHAEFILDVLDVSQVIVFTLETFGELRPRGN